MQIQRRPVIAAVVVALLVLLLVVRPGADGPDVGPDQPEATPGQREPSPTDSGDDAPPDAERRRLVADDEVLLGVDLSRHGWTTSAQAVLVPAGDGVAAAAGSIVAAALQAPLLVADRDLSPGQVASEVVVELGRLAPSSVAVIASDLGRGQALVASVGDALAATLPDLETEVHTGATPAELTAEVADLLQGLVPRRDATVEVVVAADGPSALAAAPAAARRTGRGDATLILVGGAEPLAPDDVAVVVGPTAEAVATIRSELAEDQPVVSIVGSTTEVATALVRRWELADGDVLLTASVATAALGSVGANAAATDAVVVPASGIALPAGLRAVRAATGHPAELRVAATSAGVDLVLEEAAAVVVQAGLGVLGALPPTSARLGLHVTSDELHTWRVRAATGPFRSDGDVGPGSPGDWERIRRQAAAVVEAPQEAVWSGPVDDGCVNGRGTVRNDPPEEFGWIRDLAFEALVLQDADARAVAADLLRRQAAHPGVDFADRDRWCLGRIRDLNPGFEIANWLTSLLYALEYVEIGDRIDGTRSLTPEEAHAVVDWFAAAAEWMDHDTNDSLEENFEERGDLEGPPYPLSADRVLDPRLTEDALAEVDQQIGAIARYYNNRRAQMQRFVGLLGLHVLNRPDGHRPPVGDTGATAEDFVASATRFVHDWLVYSVYPQGFAGDFGRWNASLPDLGWFYGVSTAAPAVTFADALARSGDPALLRLETSEGVHGTAGVPRGTDGKSLPWFVRTLVGYVDGSLLRHVPGREGDADGRIDGVHESWHGIHDLSLLPLNRHVGDPWLDAFGVWRPGGFPGQPAGFGQYSPFNGDWGTLPGVLFMFGMQVP